MARRSYELIASVFWTTKFLALNFRNFSGLNEMCWSFFFSLSLSVRNSFFETVFVKIIRPQTKNKMLPHSLKSNVLVSETKFINLFIAILVCVHCVQWAWNGKQWIFISEYMYLQKKSTYILSYKNKYGHSSAYFSRVILAIFRYCFFFVWIFCHVFGMSKFHAGIIMRHSKLHLNWSIEYYLPIICSELINDRESMSAKEMNEPVNKKKTQTKKNPIRFSLLTNLKRSWFNNERTNSNNSEIKCDKM